ncbi:ketosynthase chain-length factor [Saccharopolyspora phatthalungensis]|uniref:Act minimal PKS chain-length factor (CLF/KS beta) n=1 Tax=Saccharopolyspora phatthalungensis TaxID=664693 RepID=A0A840Q808_9PSEU|nr:ketosynthase chain-length factor [Saccharopolyspora phatthalungensis]MBB5156854.1 act minimal PKS chain-length factor (CLF/KS beta) [Saccharopolyspora phatthalungensis]
MNGSVVVTGLGLVTPNGLGTEDVWSATLRGRSGLAMVDRFDPSQYPAWIAGEVFPFAPEQHISSRLIPQTDHMTRLALTAADYAVRDAKIDLTELPEFGAGVVTAATTGGFEFGQRELERLWSKGPQHVSAYQSFAWFYAVNTGQISIRHGLRGPAGVVVGDQAGGLDAIAQARRQVRKGTSLMIAGGADSTLCPWAWVAQLANNLMSRATEPDQAYVPFDDRACGYVPGEGAAMLVLQPGAGSDVGPVAAYGEIAGHAATFDRRAATGMSAGLRKAIELALIDASLTPSDIDVVFADGYAVKRLDDSEVTAIADVFGVRGVPVTVPKTMVGRLYSAGPVLDLALALLALRDGVIPPTINSAPGSHHALDLVVGQPRTAALNAALVIARGYGGFNSAMVVKSLEE